MTELRLNPDLDVAAYRETYRANGRVRIGGLLVPDDAAWLHDYLDAQEDWWHLINTHDGVLEFDRSARARMGVQYRYEGLRVPDDPEEVESDDDGLDAFARLMSSVPMLTMLRRITGHDAITFSDGHATAYGPGDFLTGHDDAVAGKHRLAAYVFGLTPVWRPEWGGILMFHESVGAVVTGHVPSFNTLDLFAVPQRNSVSIVTTSAPIRRYAVTGWLRSD